MPSHGRSDRRHRGHKGHDDEHYLGAQGDETHSGTYSRHNEISHRTESYRVSSSSSRTSYDTSREASTSRGHRHTESWRRGDTEEDRHNYTSNEGYHRHGGGRNDYEDVDGRDSEGWSTRSRDNPQYSQSREWSQRYDRGYVPLYAESSSWNTTTSLPHETRNVPFDRWASEDSRLDDHRGMAGPDERQLDREPLEWHRDQRQEKNGQKFQSDSGWNSRRRGKGWGEPAWDDPPPKKDSSNTDDRSWEPAPTWKPSNRSIYDSANRNGQRSNQTNRNARGGKRAVYPAKAKRDWRNDDGTLNNWQKRDSHDIRERIAKVPVKKKHPRSPSRSRSRSPTDSYYSRRSSRGRSRSRSVSPIPKRRRREASPAAPHSRTPSDRGGPVWNPRSRNNREYSPSPDYHRSPQSVGGRRRSFSSASSISTERSTSRSPPGKPRPVHRLPSIGTTTTLLPNTTARVSYNGVRHSNNQRNGKSYTNVNGRHSIDIDRQKNVAFDQSSSIDSMPPPSTIPAIQHLRPVDPPRETTYTNYDTSASKVDTSTPTRFTAVKNAGFKPIGHTSSALKKFFPGEDDDTEPLDNQHPQASRGLPFEKPFPDRARTPVREKRREDTYQGGSKLSPLLGAEEDPDRRRHNPSASPHQQESQHAFSEEPRVPLRDDVQRVESPLHQGISEQDSTNIPPPPSINSQGELYNIISQVGEGTFGKVYKAQNTVTKLFVALKRIRMESEKDGFPVTAMREIKLLQSLQHPNIVRLYEMMVSNSSVYMVFEYMDHDLTGVLSQTQFNFTDAHLKSLCHQMLAGLAYLHHKGVIHRDIKGSNILINNRGELKLADFGLARFYQKRRSTDYTNRVITLWYRPPELLFGATVYGPEVDMWSAGCIMLELFTKKPVFQGNDEIHQLDVVYKIIGTPTPERWAGVMELPWYELVKPKEVIPNHFRELFQKWMSPAALDLAEQLLAYDPSQRITALQAMDAYYFTQEEPRAALPTGLITLEGEWHELETKRERARKRRKPDIVLQ